MTTYTTLNDNSAVTNNKVTTRTLLHEAIPLTGTIVSGTYSDNNIKNYAHGMFQSVYDYPYLSSSANHIFDISLGYSAQSSLSASTNNQNSKKLNMYSQMAQVLMGYDVTGSILRFDEDGNIAGGGKKLDEVVFFNFARLLSKDEIKKGTFEMDFGVESANNAVTYDGKAFAKQIKVTDFSGSSGFLVNSPAGEYGVLYATASSAEILYPAAAASSARLPVGLVFYQAGIAVVSGSIFNQENQGGILNNTLFHNVSMSGPEGSVEQFNAVITGSLINAAADNIRNRISNIQFNNTIELNSTIYFCRVANQDYNYSSNPTYLSASQLRVKQFSTDMPVSYITTVGLYNSANELLAVAKLSEPLKKTPDTEFTIRVRLDY